MDQQKEVGLSEAPDFPITAAPLPKECEPISDVHNKYIGIIGFYIRKIMVVHSFRRQTARTSKGRLMTMWQWSKCIIAKKEFCGWKKDGTIWQIVPSTLRIVKKKIGIRLLHLKIYYQKNGIYAIFRK